MTSPALTNLRAKLLAQTGATGLKASALTVKRKRAWMERALCAHGADQVWDRIRDCGTDRKRCGSQHCTRCFNRYVETQTTRVRALFGRYTSEADQRANIRHLTVLFDAFGFDLYSKPYPTLPIQRVKAARHYARTELYALKRHFPAVTIVGAFEMEPIDAPTKALRKDASAIDALLDKGQCRSTVPSLYNVVSIPSMQQWDDHVVLFHGHFVIDLNGTSDRDFREWCHARWGHNCPNTPVRRGAYIQKLYTNRKIDESINVLSRYPLKTPFHFHIPRDKLGNLVAELRLYEDEILSAMILGLRDIGIRGMTVDIGT